MEIILPKKDERFGDLADVMTLPPKELRELLGKQCDALAVRANQAALRTLKELAEKDELPRGSKAREAVVKELMAYGMFADAINRQRQMIQKETAPDDEALRNQGKPTVEIPKTLDDKSWEEKYGSAFLDKVAVEKTN